LIFLRDIVSLKPTIVQVIGHFLTSVKFCGNIKILQKKSKFCGLARNSVACGKLAVLEIMFSVCLFLSVCVFVRVCTAEVKCYTNRTKMAEVP